MRLKMTIGICPPPSGPTPVAREMRRVSEKQYQDGILKDEKLGIPLPLEKSLRSSNKARSLGAWDAADSPNSHHIPP